MVIGKRLVTLPAFYRAGHPAIKLEPDQVRAVRQMNARIEDGRIPFEEVDCLCGWSGFDQIGATDRYGLAQSTMICTRCGLLQSNPRMTDEAYRDFYESDEYRRIYDSVHFLARYEDFYRDGRGESVFERVTRQRSPREISSVLEFGAGGGWNLVPFRDAGVEVTGYDYSPELVALGRAKGINLAQGGIESVQGRYEVIILNEVLEHLTDVPGILRRLRGHLAPGGLIWVEVPDAENFHIGQLQNAHTYYFTRKTLEFAVGLAGLRMAHFLAGREMSATFVSTDNPPLDLGFLAGHYDEMAALIRRFERTYRFRLPLRALARALDSVGLKEPVRDVLRPRRATRST